MYYPEDRTNLFVGWIISENWKEIRELLKKLKPFQYVLIISQKQTRYHMYTPISALKKAEMLNLWMNTQCENGTFVYCFKYEKPKKRNLKPKPLNDAESYKKIRESWRGF